MKNLAAAAVAAVLLVAGCGDSQEASTTDVAQPEPGVALHELLDEHFERDLEMNPLNATFIGDYRYNDRMANSNSPEYIAELTAMDEEFLLRLLEIDRGQLGYQDHELLCATRQWYERASVRNRKRL